MEYFNSALGRNITFVRPAYFIFNGFVGIAYVKYYYVFLLFVYIVSVLGNSAVMVVIILDHNLRSPKYIAVFNLAFADLFGNTALVPKFLDIFLFNNPHIRYNDCLAFLFFCFICLTMQALNLVALAYDRLMAIMFPLHYHVRMTHRFMLSLIVFFWLFSILIVVIAIGLLTRLSFCKSVVINSYFCDHGPLYRLACNDNSPSNITALVIANVVLWFSLAFILTTYCAITYALSKISTAKEKARALKTCSSHLSLVAIYFLPLILVYRLGRNFHPNVRIISLSLTTIVLPMLNPIIYVLQTAEIKNSMRMLLNNLKCRISAK